MKATPLDTVAAWHRTLPKPALPLPYSHLLFLKVAGSQPCLRILLQPISLHLLMNIHELTPTPMQFTNGIFYIYIYIFRYFIIIQSIYGINS